MKKIISLVCVMVMIFNCMIIAQGAEGEENAIKLTIGEKKIVKVENGVENVMETDVAPMIKDGRTFVPVRGIFEIIGAEISWDGDEKAVTVKTTDNEVIVRIDNKQARVNGKRVMMDAPPFIQDGRTLIPLRFISENLGYSVAWEGETQTITITGFEFSGETSIKEENKLNGIEIVEESAIGVSEVQEDIVDVTDVEKLEFEEKEVIVCNGILAELPIKVVPEGAIKELKFTAKNGSILSVTSSKNGCLISPLKRGTTEIICESENGKKAICKVAVVDIDITLSNGNRIKVGETKSFEVNIQPDIGLKEEITWTTLGKYASISEKGVIKGEEEGSTTVTATIGKIEDAFKRRTENGIAVYGGVISKMVEVVAGDGKKISLPGGITLQLPLLPKTYTYGWRNIHNDWLYTKIKLEDIDITMSRAGKLTVKVKGECIDTNVSGGACIISYTLYDEDGYKIDSGELHFVDTKKGDKFKNQEETIYVDLEAKTNYVLKLGE